MMDRVDSCIWVEWEFSQVRIRDAVFFATGGWSGQMQDDVRICVCLSKEARKEARKGEWKCSKAKRIAFRKIGGDIRLRHECKSHPSANNNKHSPLLSCVLPSTSTRLFSSLSLC